MRQSPRQAPATEKFGRRFERALKQILYGFFDKVWPAGPARPISPAESVRSILVVRANFRMGNIILTSALLPVLRARFPHARVDFLTGDNTARLLEGLPVGRTHVISRSFACAPWRLIALFRQIRRQRYDLAIDGGMGSYSGAVYAWLSGARETLGHDGSACRFLSHRLDFKPFENVYETAPAVARSLGVTADAWPVYCVSENERAEAAGMLDRFGLRNGGIVTPFVGIFPGGHSDKRWPKENWLRLIALLNRSAVDTMVFLGPEETDMLPDLRAPQFDGVRIVLPGMRRTASLLAHATLLITPDSGPMHLAAALRVPIVAIILNNWSHTFVPPAEHRRILDGSSIEEIAAAAREHPAWTSRAGAQIAQRVSVDSRSATRRPTVAYPAVR